MKLTDHVEQIRKLIERAFRNRLGRMGMTTSGLLPVDSIPAEYNSDRKRIETIREVMIAETGSVAEAYEKLVEEFTFTLFNRLAALKVMEAHTLHPEIITRRSQHGDRAFAHKHWLEQNPDGRIEEMEGLVRFMEEQLTALATDIPLFSLQHPYHLLPTAIELNGIINAFNQVETDSQVEDDIWKSDDVLGWLYESYNNYKKTAHKESGDKTEFNKVSIQSQVYTPRWIVKFLVDNSLGKLYLEMYPDSDIKNRYKIANAPKARTRTPKPLTEIKLIDPATGSGNYLLYGFDLFYDLYTDQIDHYGADYDDRKIAELIIAHNLHGIDLDDRAIQLAQLGLYIKAKRKKHTAKIDHFNIVSSDFFLPAYSEVKHLFEGEEPLSPELEKIVTDLWADLQQAYKFGSLIRLEEKFSMRLHGLVQQFEKVQLQIFSTQTLANYENFRDTFFNNLQKAVTLNATRQGQTFLNTKTQDAIAFLRLLTQKYDVAVANPPYTDSADFGPELKTFVEKNYKQPYRFNSNLYTTFILRCYELIEDNGKMALIHPLTFMYITSFEDVRTFLVEKCFIEIFIEFGLGGIFTSKVDVDVAGYTIEKNRISAHQSYFMNLQEYKGLSVKRDIFEQAYSDFLNGKSNKHNFLINQSKLKEIQGWPIIYNISDTLRKRFENKSLEEYLDVKVGLQTGSNERFTRFWWEVLKESISINYPMDKKKWIFYAKGGPFNKWYGNNWAIVNWHNDGHEIKNYTDENGRKKARPQNERFYLQEGISYTASGSSGVSFRYHPSNFLFDVGGSCIFTTDKYTNLDYLISFLNSTISFFLANTLNPTVNTQVGDLKRIPFVIPPKTIETQISLLGNENIQIKRKLVTFRVFEYTYLENPLLSFKGINLHERILNYFNYVNQELSVVLINEAIINNAVFHIYDLNEEDKNQVEIKIGIPIGALSLSLEAKTMFLDENITLPPIAKEYIEGLPTIVFDEKQINMVKSEFESLYTGNNEFEDFCVSKKLNPINVWYWFKQAKILPKSRTQEIALELLVDSLRHLLMEDEDGMIPLIGLPGEPKLMDRLEQYWFQQGFTLAQFMQLEGLLRHPMNEYLEHWFFDDFSNLINLYRHMPKSPFIWHLSSGEHQGFEAYIIIYKWDRDSLYKLKSSYLSKRTESLQYRLQQIGDSTSAHAQTEKETIRLQLQEIDVFAKKIDELIAEGYDPKLDDGVGKNIAPLQKKGMLRAEVLKSTQLQKYLNADW
jgi:hypothetical protein